MSDGNDMSPPQPPSEPEPRDAEAAERGRAIIAAAVADTRAPLALRERIAADAARWDRPAPTARRRRLAWPAGALAAALAAVAIAVVLAAGGGGAGPTAVAVASAAQAGPTRPAPPADPSHQHLLARDVDGVAFPDWSDAFSWKPSGERADTIEGRATRTVFYTGPNGARAAYTIVAGGALDVPPGAQTRTLHGVELHVARADAGQVVTWERNGHTCVLTAPASVPTSRLLELAAWDGGGDVPY
jgi:hypothetical protein